MLRQYDAGVPTRELAEHFGIRVRAVRQILTKNGRQLRVAVEVSDGDADRAAKLYVDDRLSIARVGQELDLPLSAVRRALRSRAVQLRNKHDWTRPHS